MTSATKVWDAESGRYVDIDLAMTTFGPLGAYGEAAVNDNGGFEAVVNARKEAVALMRTLRETVAMRAEERAKHQTGPVRPGDFMQTYTGRKFWPLDPRTDEVCIEDIAHALSMQCRYGGHCLRFYSVAEHSVLMARAVGPDVALWALLHDAAEAYVADMPRPLKRFLAGYKDVEAKVMAAVCDKFGLPHEMPAAVKDSDERILADEIRQNMAPMDWHGEHAEGLGVTLRFWRPEVARDAFLAEFQYLTRRRAAA